MKEGPNIALLGSLIGDPARANILMALMSGKALTASELACEAGITAQTASAHLAKLEAAGLLLLRKQGRHRYFALSDADVGNLLETMMGVAAKHGHIRTRPGPKDAELRKSRACYNHLAGALGVHMLGSLVAQNYIIENAEHLDLTDSGRLFLSNIGINVASLEQSRSPLCKPCLDWSERRPHLAGALGAALLNHFYEQGWAKRQEGSRVIAFLTHGEQQFMNLFPASKASR